MSIIPVVCSLNNRRPAGNFALHQRGEWLLTSFCFARAFAADIEKALAQGVSSRAVSSASYGPRAYSFPSLGWTWCCC
jgi:hypothetical protein